MAEANMEIALENEVGRLLESRRWKLALAESCTGGLVGHRITNVPGSSGYFMGGVVCYSNEAKSAILGVSQETLDAFGAVSRQAVLEMAHGAKRLFDADIAASISGIAGPGGGTLDKPVGTTWVGLAAGDGGWARGFHFSGDREQNKAASAEAALQMILDYLEGRIG
jgi:PncC family amidohydrolase